MNDLIHRIVGIIIEAGQSDTTKFKLGETIRYNPSEILEILKQHESEIFGEESSTQPDSKESSSTHKALDTISRQAAIDAVNDVIADYIPNIYGRYEALPLEMASAINRLPSAQPEDWMEQNKDRILKAGMEGREIEFRIGGRLFAIREKAQ